MPPMNEPPPLKRHPGSLSNYTDPSFAVVIGTRCEDTYKSGSRVTIDHTNNDEGGNVM